jgi:hypothetical protein
MSEILTARLAFCARNQEQATYHIRRPPPGGFG